MTLPYFSCDFENGSKIWLYEQSKLTRTILNNIESEAVIALEWMIEDDFAVGIISAQAVVTSNGTGVIISIQRPSSEVDQRFFKLWDNTGISNNGS